MTLDKTSDIVSAQDYYPYGEILRSYTLGSGANKKYYFTEKERDTETNYDYPDGMVMRCEIWSLPR
jgi:hypothetical protein